MPYGPSLCGTASADCRRQQYNSDKPLQACYDGQLGLIQLCTFLTLKGMVPAYAPALALSNACVG